MGTTGSSDAAGMNTALPVIIERVNEHATVPLAVGFGVSSRAHVEAVADAGADGVVVGSRLAAIIKVAPEGQAAQKVEEYCRQLSLKGQPPAKNAARKTPSRATSAANGIAQAVVADQSDNVLPPRFGGFGGQYVPEALFECLAELEEAHKAAMADPEFWKEWESLYAYSNRPSNLYFADKLTEHAGGAKIWLKREDLCVAADYSLLRACSPRVRRSNHTGSHKINNALGQVSNAYRLTALTAPLTGNRSSSLAASARSVSSLRQAQASTASRPQQCAPSLAWSASFTWAPKTYAGRR
jgi:tryptophan synthase